MTGTFINAGAIIVGGFMGLWIGSRFPERINKSILQALGIFSLAFALQMFLKTENPIIPLIAILLGVMVGELLEIETKVQLLGKKLEDKLIKNTSENSPQSGMFMKGFISTSLLYCIGPMSILGAVENGLTGEFNTLAVKSVLDFFASLAFASSLGLGVVFSSVPVFLYQGVLSLLAEEVQSILNQHMINEFTAVGGLILMAISISGFLEIKTIRTANFLPALIFAPLVSLLFQSF